MRSWFVVWLIFQRKSLSKISTEENQSMWHFEMLHNEPKFIDNPMEIKQESK